VQKVGRNENLKYQYFPAMLIFSTSAITNAVIALLLANKHQEIFSSILFMIKQKNVRDKMRYNNLISKLCSQARLCSSQARLCSSQAS
jgi:hypothetical protein